jgi:hypothetical protein
VIFSVNHPKPGVCWTVSGKGTNRNPWKGTTVANLARIMGEGSDQPIHGMLRNGGENKEKCWQPTEKKNTSMARRATALHISSALTRRHVPQLLTLTLSSSPQNPPSNRTPAPIHLPTNLPQPFTILIHENGAESN